MKKDLIDVPMDAAGKVAERLMTLREQQLTLKENIKKAEAELITELKKVKRENIRVKDKLFSIKIIASKEKIVISK